MDSTTTKNRNKLKIEIEIELLTWTINFAWNTILEVYMRRT